MSLVYWGSISSYFPLTMSDTSLRGFYRLGENKLVYILNKAFVACCMIDPMVQQGNGKENLDYC